MAGSHRHAHRSHSRHTAHARPPPGLNGSVTDGSVTDDSVTDAPDPRARLAQARLYLCTDARRTRGDLAEFLDAALPAGVDIVQLRDKHLEAREELDATRDDGRRLPSARNIARRQRPRRHRTRRPRGRAPPRPARHPRPRRPTGDRRPSPRRPQHTHPGAGRRRGRPNQESTTSAPARCGPPPPNPDAPPPASPSSSTSPSAQPGRPWFAIGGIDHTNLDDVLTAGATRVVVVRAITEADDPATAAAALAQQLQATHPATW